MGLTQKDIDLKRGRIEVHRQWLTKEQCYGSTKGGGKRTIHFDPRSELSKTLATAFLRSNNQTLLKSYNGKAVDSRVVSKAFQRTAKRAGVPVIRFHDLRHTFASWFMMTHGDIWKLKAILGHQCITTTERYAHLSKNAHNVTQFEWAKQ